MSRLQRWPILPPALLTIEIAGCRRAPTFNILGSFFPAWLICLFAGIGLSVIAYRIFARFALDKEILWPIVVYPCLALLFASIFWLIFFS
jgi:hypothetical protein